MSGSSDAAIRLEVANYTAAVHSSQLPFDACVLSWWACQQTNMPMLAKRAKSTLAATPTAISVDGVFSRFGISPASHISQSTETNMFLWARRRLQQPFSAHYDRPKRTEIEETEEGTGLEEDSKEGVMEQGEEHRARSEEDDSGQEWG